MLKRWNAYRLHGHSRIRRPFIGSSAQVGEPGYANCATTPSSYEPRTTAHSLPDESHRPTRSHLTPSADENERSRFYARALRLEAGPHGCYGIRQNSAPPDPV